MSEAWVGADEVARHLDVAKDTIYRWIEARGLPTCRADKLWKFKLSEVDAWVERAGADEELRRRRPPSKGGRM